MKTHPVRLLRAAIKDLRTAGDYYATWRTDGRRHFRTLAEDAFRKIALNPEISAPLYRHFLRVILSHSHYAAYYVIEPRQTTLVAILDMRRDPRMIHDILEHRTSH